MRALVCYVDDREIRLTRRFFHFVSEVHEMLATVMSETCKPVGACEPVGAQAPVSGEPPIQREPVTTALALIPDPFLRRIRASQIPVGTLEPTLMRLPEMFW
jgi:hypothetical protein